MPPYMTFFIKLIMSSYLIISPNILQIYPISLSTVTTSSKISSPPGLLYLLPIFLPSTLALCPIFHYNGSLNSAQKHFLYAT